MIYDPLNGCVHGAPEDWPENVCYPPHIADGVKKQSMKTTREEVYRAIDSERAYQDAKCSERFPTYRGNHEVGAFITMFRSYLVRAEQAWTDHDGDAEALEVIRKLAGIAVNCMEQHGAPQRKGFER